MRIVRVEQEATLGARRGEPVVCVPVSAHTANVEKTLASLSRHTAADVRIVVCGSAGLDRMPGVSGGHTVNSLTLIATESLSQAFAVSAPADVVVVTPGCVVAEGWLDGLHDAAFSETTAATASALPSGELDSAMNEITEFDRAAAAVRKDSPRIRPRMNSPYAACSYIRRSALELVDVSEVEDVANTHERNGFAQRCLEGGLCHVLADDVLVLDPGGSSRATELPAPWARAIGAARRGLEGLSVIVDARIDAARTPGTQLHVMELIAAIARTGKARVTAVVASGTEPSARAVLEGLPGVRISTAEHVSMRRADVVHRPFQVSTPADLAALAGWADRLIITNQDLISYRNPSYFASAQAWETYRQATRAALAAADRVVFFASHVRDDAVAEDLVEPHRASVVHIGVDHRIGSSERLPVAPRRARQIPPDVEMLLCLGTDFRHKNRVFALRTAEELQRRHGWAGSLVLAGPHVALGSSAGEERALLAGNPMLADAVLDLGSVSEAEKAWLVDRAAVVIYPSVYEGFGLVPFEAASRHVPCLWAKDTSLREILPETAAGIVPWDVAATAEVAIQLMRDPEARSRNIQAVRNAAESLTWQETAERLVDVYRATCDQPSTVSALRERDAGVMRAGFSEDAVRLVGPDGALPSELERPLLALATHRKLGGPVFGAIKVGYHASHRWARKTRRR